MNLSFMDGLNETYIFNRNNFSSVPNVTKPASIAVPDLLNNYLYIAFGSIAIITNVLVAVITVPNNDLLKKSAFAIGLSIGDIINGIGLVLTGAKRIDYIIRGVSSNLLHPFECLKGFTTLWLIGVQVPASIIFLIGSERMLAVIYFTWYYKQWTSRLAWILTATAYGFCFISVSGIWMKVYETSESVKTTMNCITPSVIGSVYGTYNYGLPIVCGVAAALATVLSLLMFLRKKSKMGREQTTDNSMKRFIKRQINMTSAMLSIAILDFAFVVVPNVLLLMISYNIQLPPSLSNLGAQAAVLYCTRSSLSIFVYFALNRDFRHSALKLLQLEGTTKVQAFPSQVDTNNDPTTREVGTRL